MFGITSPARFVPAQGYLLFVCLLLSIGAARAEEIGTYNDWSAFRDGPSERPVCYMGSVPKKEEGDYQRRDDTYVLITHRPGDNTYEVVSITAGYEYKNGSEVKVEVDNQDYALFTKGDNAWGHDAATDKKLVEAMRRGSKMIVRGTPLRGTETTDTYSLSGFTAAHNAIDKACRKR